MQDFFGYLHIIHNNIISSISGKLCVFSDVSLLHGVGLLSTQEHSSTAVLHKYSGRTGLPGSN